MPWTTQPGLRLTVLVGDDDLWHHHSLSVEIVRRAHDAGLAGASIFHGVEGFGGHRTIHTARLLSFTEDLPVAVVVVDTEERVRALLPRLEPLGIQGTVTLEHLDIVAFTPADEGA
ncbi:DUF190 domain-containing protein [Streptomyces sp. GZWMJZ-114]|uniref:DUF190 domain-containing protein n=1 Tax=Streptomyces sp. GZWMJZ-114 TaxID=2494734 RepID=UPI0010124A0A|nr:DUF190 domain-containing protein [Streptomyces sp. GZWMJZ-114]